MTSAYFHSATMLPAMALLAAMGATSAASELQVINGPTVIRFDRPLARLALPWGKQFGIFRAMEPKSKQDIKETWRREKLGENNGSSGVLALKYSVNDGYNGWWLKLAPEGRAADWSRFHGGYLILRLVHAPAVWKLELKDGQEIYPVYVRLTAAQRDTISRQGYVDLALPLASFHVRRLDDLRELVFVFESNRLPPGQRSGEMLVAEIGLSLTERLTPNADEVLDDLGERSFEWFQKHRHPRSGLVLDRAPNREDFRPDPDRPAMASVASVGFYLSLLPEWVRLGYLSRSQAARQAEHTLRFVVERVDAYEGAAYHFVDWRTGARWGKSEVGLLDHAILANGAMTAAVEFGGALDVLATALLDRVDWPKFVVEDAKTGKQLLALGWSPEKGLLTPADVRSSELAMMYFLAVGSKKGVSPELWYNTAVDLQEIDGYRVLNPRLPLFTATYGLCWHRLRGPDRSGVDLDQNARQAALFNRWFCREAGRREATYSLEEGGWYGISAGDAPGNRYLAAGPGVLGAAEGVVQPNAALSALPWIAEELAIDLPSWRASRAWNVACGPFGLSPLRLGESPWVGPDLIGIDVGSFAVSLANYRAGTVWKLWMRHPVARKALERLELNSHWTRRSANDDHASKGRLPGGSGIVHRRLVQPRPGAGLRFALPRRAPLGRGRPRPANGLGAVQGHGSLEATVARGVSRAAA